MESILASISALFLTMAMIPALSRIAGPLGLYDQPGGRKVHREPTPRIGGIAIACAVCLPIVVWLPMEPATVGFLVGGAWLALLGAVDDALNLNYYWKFLAQLPAIGAAIYSGIVLQHLPFFGLDPAPAWISYTVTALFFLGITNAINLFDGLDGLAGGCILVTLAAMAYLAFLVNGAAVGLPALALISAVLAFLNFNTHPARIFLGDAGSQFLGFCAAALAIMLIEQIHTAMNPAIPLLLLGLPILDTVWVFCRRISQGRSPFVADRQHLHHQLLNSGLSHVQVVSVIYLFQVLFVASAVFLRYGSDATVVTAYVAESLIFMGFVLALRYRSRHREPTFDELSGPLSAAIDKYLQTHPRFLPLLNRIIEGALGCFIVSGAFAGDFPDDVCFAALGVAFLMIFAAVFLVSWTNLFTRIGFYTASLLVVYNYASFYREFALAHWGLHLFFGLLAIALFLGIRFASRDRFEVTPQDLLVGFIALGLAAVPSGLFGDRPLGFMAVVSVILFYSCEYLVSMSRHRYLALRLSALVSLLIIGFSGIMA